MAIPEECRNLIVAASQSFLLAIGMEDVSLLEGLSDGRRLHISVTVLPPIDEDSKGALAMKPEHYEESGMATRVRVNGGC
ncbi:hypothetical protein OJ996_15470 [Luteolibacter sp. GHJ8]|uniref:Uncharacterized protein n=1 Tax=Luteolibacter rhizosphaerae TaxID=2989719 RepID=A0ABT3G5Q2_9BACT|nr:hypothetical protein [Luteolibacter rhizosphaerae]MCW1914987.1 hypothetical protein [Luteolibacter rhizosphaerae]